MFHFKVASPISAPVHDLLIARRGEAISRLRNMTVLQVFASGFVTVLLMISLKGKMKKASAENMPWTMRPLARRYLRSFATCCWSTLIVAVLAKWVTYADIVMPAGMLGWDSDGKVSSSSIFVRQACWVKVNAVFLLFRWWCYAALYC